MLFICQECKKEFEARGTTRKFCSLSCSCKFRNRTFDIKKCWQEKYGDMWEERYEKWREKMSNVTSGANNPMFGRHDHVHGLKKYALEKTGKSLEEIHGSEAAKNLRLRLSSLQAGENNPAFGKIYDNGGKSLKGYYKGRFFRSLLEYSFMKHLESQGIALEVVEYESFKIPYTLSGSPRTYTIDFYVKSQNIVYEVKPSYALKSVTNQCKFEAAQRFFESRGIMFKIVTESDFRKISFQDAQLDSDIVWKEETFRYFRRSK